MNILWHMPTLRLSTCGLSRRAWGFAEGLVDTGHDVAFLVAADKTDFDDGAEIDSCRIGAVSIERSQSIHWSMQARSRLTDAAQVLRSQSETPDLFITCQPEAIPAARAQWPGTPRLYVCGGVTLLHDAYDAQRQQALTTRARIAFYFDRLLKRRNESTAFRLADAIVFDSQSTRARVNSEYGIAPAKAHAVYAAVDADAFRPATAAERRAARQRFGLAESDVCLIWSGRMSPEKNLSVLVDALVQLATSYKLLLVGSGPLENELHAQIAERQLDGRIIMPGSRQDMRPALWAADVFVFPSVSESLGLSLIEAMATGLPCVALQANGAAIRNASAEILDDGRCGVLVDDNHAGAFARVIETLWNDAARRNRLVQAARTRASAEFAWAGGQARFNHLVEGLSCRFIGTGDDLHGATSSLVGS